MASEGHVRKRKRNGDHDRPSDHANTTCGQPSIASPLPDAAASPHDDIHAQQSTNSDPDSTQGIALLLKSQGREDTETASFQVRYIPM